MATTLDEAYAAILDAIIEAIQGEAVEGGTLEEVETVVRGDKARPLPKNPSVWVVPGAMENQPPDFGEDETWLLPVAVAGMVTSDDPEQASRDVARITARARAAAIKDHRLGLAYVIDATSKTFDPASRTSERNRNIHWADATIEVTFSVTE